MMEAITTNGASILTILVLWSTITWAVTYIYMAKKVDDKDYVIGYLDEYIEQTETYLDVLRAEMEEDNKYIIGLEDNLWVEMEAGYRARNPKDEKDLPINYYPTGK